MRVLHVHIASAVWKPHPSNDLEGLTAKRVNRHRHNDSLPDISSDFGGSLDMLSRPKPLSNAHLLDREADRVRVTHPFHPLFDRELEIVDRRHFQDEEYVYVDIGNSEVARLPEVWTSLGPADPFIAISAGRSIFLVKDLVRLSRLVADLLRESQAPDRNGGEDVM
jgi:hypothetical protein